MQNIEYVLNLPFVTSNFIHIYSLGTKGAGGGGAREGSRAAEDG